MRPLTFYEFFAGGGMARAGLGDGWTCAFANDFDAMKAETYRRNWSAAHFRLADVAALGLSDLPAGTADLAWASFPCQDLSLAGGQTGLGADGDNAATRSGAFWPFWRLMRGLVALGRGPRAIVLENVHGVLTSHGGRDFSAIAAALAKADYRFGALVVNAARFVPQSRPRVFFVALRDGAGAAADGPSDFWHPAALRRAAAALPPAAARRWLWWNPPVPPLRTKTFADVVEDDPSDVTWHSAEATRRLIEIMSDLNREKLRAAQRAGRRVVGAVYRRTRPGPDGKRQRAEVRFDDVSGCLRTPAGGSSRQTLLVVEGRRVRSRLLSAREAARLMGLPDSYALPARYNDAYHVCGDGVCVPAVRFLAATILEPALRAGAFALAAE